MSAMFLVANLITLLFRVFVYQITFPPLLMPCVCLSTNNPWWHPILHVAPGNDRVTEKLLATKNPAGQDEDIW